MISHYSTLKTKTMEEKLIHILVIQDIKGKQTIHLRENKYTIGRNLSNSIVIYSPQVSRLHATLLLQGNEKESSFIIIDGDTKGKRSNNGIHVNGKKCYEHQLKHADFIQIGYDVKATYHISYSSQSLNKKYKPTRVNTQTIFEIESKKTIEFFSEESYKLDYKELARLASFPELCPHPIFEINLEGELTYQNPAAHQKFPQLNKAKWKHPLIAALPYQPQNLNGHVFKREVTIGNHVFEEYIHYLIRNKIIRVYVFEITLHKISQEKFLDQMFFDLMTQLPNQLFFKEQLSKAIANSKQSDKYLGIMSIDIDQFKTINDQFSPRIGDNLLKRFAQKLTSCFREGDTLARWKGDQFIVLLPEINQIQNTVKIVQRITKTFEEPFKIGNQKEVSLSCSIGIAIYPNDGENPEILIKNANTALDLAKDNPKGSYRFYSTSLQVKHSQLLRLENQLHKALERLELLLHYQPQINIKTGKIQCLEALIRWQHPQLGLIFPEKFLSIAEETGLIIPIGEWVLKTACTQNRIWQNLGLPPLRISVNLSSQQFQQADLRGKIIDILNKTGIKPNLLELEITENILIENLESARKILCELLRTGINISMDDFGSGYACLGYLKNFPFHSLKIDQNFIQNMKNNQQDLAIIEAALVIARGFNMRVIAEGVESQEQFDLLKDLQCDEIQGYWLSKPLKAEEIPKFLKGFSFPNQSK